MCPSASARLPAWCVGIVLPVETNSSRFPPPLTLGVLKLDEAALVLGDVWPSYGCEASDVARLPCGGSGSLCSLPAPNTAAHRNIVPRVSRRSVVTAVDSAVAPHPRPHRKVRAVTVRRACDQRASSAASTAHLLSCRHPQQLHSQHPPSGFRVLLLVLLCDAMDYARTQAAAALRSHLSIAILRSAG